MSARASRAKALARVVIPLVAGAATYALLRPTEVWFVTKLGGLPGLRAVTVPLGARVPDVVLGVVPDLAWAFSLGALLSLLWRRGSRRAATTWLVLGALATVGYEIAQGLALVPGTFDVLDLLAQAIGYAAGWWSNRASAHTPERDRAVRTTS